MRKSKKEFIYNNNINLHYLQENNVKFLTFIILSNVKLKIKKKAYNKLFFAYIPKISSMCIISGRRRGLIKSLGLSRISLRSLIYNGTLTGYRKSSW